jgi:hypothetical protein
MASSKKNKSAWPAIKHNGRDVDPLEKLGELAVTFQVVASAVEDPRARAIARILCALPVADLKTLGKLEGIARRALEDGADAAMWEHDRAARVQEITDWVKTTAAPPEIVRAIVEDVTMIPPLATRCARLGDVWGQTDSPRGPMSFCYLPSSEPVTEAKKAVKKLQERGITDREAYVKAVLRALGDPRPDAVYSFAEKRGKRGSKSRVKRRASRRSDTR